MTSSSRNLILLLLAAAAVPGCRTAWPFASATDAGNSTVAAKPAADPPSPALPALSILEESQASFTTPTSAPAQTSTSSGQLTAEQAFAQVLGDLEELGRADPAALQQLLKQLQTAKPAHYPLVVQQFKASYAYSRELRERSRTESLPPVEALPMDNAEPMKPASETDEVEPRLLPKPLSSLDDPRTMRLRLTEQVPTETGMASFSKGSLLRRIDPRQTISGEPSAKELESPPARPHAVVHAAYEQEAASSEAKVAANSATVPVAVDTWEQSLTRAIEGLSVATREEPQSTADPHNRVRLRLLELAAGRYEAAQVPIDGLSAGEQEFWSKQLSALATLLDHQSQPDEQRRAAAASVPLVEAVNELGEICPLTARNLAFCSRIHGYGAYELLTNTTFEPGQRLTLYAEVENYRSVSTSRGFHTSLATSYQLLDATGKRVDGNEFPTIDDYCLRRRRDFYTQYGITLPARLSPGKYQLRLTIEDNHSDKLSHASAEFEIQ